MDTPLGDGEATFFHLGLCPFGYAKVEGAAVKVVAFAEEVLLVEFAEHGDGADAVEDGEVVGEVAPVAETDKGEDGFVEHTHAEADDVFAEAFDGVALGLAWLALADAKVVGALVLLLRNQDGIALAVFPDQGEDAAIRGHEGGVVTVAEGDFGKAVAKSFDEGRQHFALGPMERQRGEAGLDGGFDGADGAEEGSVLSCGGGVDDGSSAGLAEACIIGHRIYPTERGTP